MRATHAAAVAALAVALVATAARARAEDDKDAKKTVAFDAPADWKAKEPRGGLGPKLEYELPAVEGEAEAAKVTLHYFGGSGGGFDDNLKRWAGQFTDADGKALVPEKVPTEKLEAGTVKIALADLAGTWTPPSFGMGKSAPKPGWRMLAAVVEAADGPWFARLTGSAKSIEKHREAYLKWLKSAHAIDKK